MFAELLTVEQNELVRDLFESYPFKPYIWAIGKEREKAAVDYLLAQINEIVRDGGIARAYYLEGKVRGLCVVKPDRIAASELGQKTYEVTHLMALGKPQTQLAIKSLLVRELLRELPKTSCIVARCPYTDLTSVNALESCGFCTTHTALVLAKDLSDTDWLTTPAENYRVTPVDLTMLDDFDDLVSDIPEGILGWDYKLPRNFLIKVHRDWLRTYARANETGKTDGLQPATYQKSCCASTGSLLAAYDRGRAVGIVAERIKPNARNLLGFNIGTIDIITTAEEYKGNGVATQLLKDTLGQFAQNGVRVAQLILNSNDSAHIYQYQEMGFFTVGSRLILVYRGANRNNWITTSA